MYNYRFTELWWDKYLKEFRSSIWNYNSVIVPGLLQKKHPGLVHVEKKLMMHPNWTPAEIEYLYQEDLFYDWKQNFVIHLWYRKYNKHHTPENIKRLNTTMGLIFRHFYYGHSDMI